MRGTDTGCKCEEGKWGGGRVTQGKGLLVPGSAPHLLAFQVPPICPDRAWPRVPSQPNNVQTLENPHCPGKGAPPFLGARPV